MQRLKWIAHEELTYDQEPVLRVSQRARRILDMLNAHLTGAVDSVQYARICRDLKQIISNQDAARVLCSELQAVVGCSLSKGDRVRLACSIAGAVHEAKQSSIVGLLMMDVDELTCWARIRKVERCEDVTQEIYLRWHILVCNTVFAGAELYGNVPLESSRRWSLGLGLSGSRFVRYGWHTWNQFLDAAMLVRVAKKSGQLELVGAGANESVLSQNRKLAAGRSRLKTSCRYGARYDCGKCAVGRNQCDRSVVLEETNFDLGE